jgi:hypothetical protein
MEKDGHLQYKLYCLEKDRNLQLFARGRRESGTQALLAANTLWSDTGSFGQPPHALFKLIANFVAANHQKSLYLRKPFQLRSSSGDVTVPRSQVWCGDLPRADMELSEQCWIGDVLAKIYERLIEELKEKLKPVFIRTNIHYPINY